MTGLCYLILTRLSDALQGLAIRVGASRYPHLCKARVYGVWASRRYLEASRGEKRRLWDEVERG